MAPEDEEDDDYEGDVCCENCGNPETDLHDCGECGETGLCDTCLDDHDCSADDDDTDEEADEVVKEEEA